MSDKTNENSSNNADNTRPIMTYTMTVGGYTIEVQGLYKINVNINEGKLDKTLTLFHEGQETAIVCSTMSRDLLANHIATNIRKFAPEEPLYDATLTTKRLLPDTFLTNNKKPPENEPQEDESARLREATDISDAFIDEQKKYYKGEGSLDDLSNALKNFQLMLKYFSDKTTNDEYNEHTNKLSSKHKDFFISNFVEPIKTTAHDVGLLGDQKLQNQIVEVEEKLKKCSANEEQITKSVQPLVDHINNNIKKLEYQLSIVEEEDENEDRESMQHQQSQVNPGDFDDNAVITQKSEFNGQEEVYSPEKNQSMSDLSKDQPTQKNDNRPVVKSDNTINKNQIKDKISKWNILLGVVTGGLATLIQGLASAFGKDLWIKSKFKGHKNKIDEMQSKNTQDLQYNRQRP